MKKIYAEKLDTEELIKKVKILNHNTPNVAMEDADTIFADILQNSNAGYPGQVEKIIKIWTASENKIVFESLFETITGISFHTFLRQCEEQIVCENNETVYDYLDIDIEYGDLIRCQECGDLQLIQEGGTACGNCESENIINYLDKNGEPMLHVSRKSLTTLGFELE